MAGNVDVDTNQCGENKNTCHDQNQGNGKENGCLLESKGSVATEENEDGESGDSDY